MATINYESLIVDIPDYPEPGVIFKDITPLLADSQGLAAIIDDISGHFLKCGITKVIGTEARGFLIGAPVAYRLGVGFVPARKPGKLPRDVYSEKYALEYGTDELEIHKDALAPGDHVLIVDDLVATAGTAVATARLVQKAGATVAGFGFLLELGFLGPRDIIGKEFDQEVYSLVTID
ncbi:MAG: adenine phosphoribosyltransferase [Atopobiaceae bacterium]|nr:adenine phosphoribosyltransferase [Atopobiaceae bacterium]